jgi:hypothetical protein
LLVIDNDGRGIGFHCEAASDITSRHAVAVGVELEADILVHERFGGVAIVGPQGWQRPQAIGPEALLGLFASFTVRTNISDLIEPAADLRVDIDEVAELA